MGLHFAWIIIDNVNSALHWQYNYVHNNMGMTTPLVGVNFVRRLMMVQFEQQKGIELPLITAQYFL